MKSLMDLSCALFGQKGLLHADGKLGGSEEENGCTYNFNRDTDALCFKNALSRFVRTGAGEDAFDVYFCYAEIFKTFGGYKDGIDSLLQLLYQHETTSSTLLTKHRDHYSHSVYVFALGLAIFSHNANMRKAFEGKFGSADIDKNFLKFWGLTALFHDIGYPYEITFMQALEYGRKIDGAESDKAIKIRYDNLDAFLSLTDEEVAKCGQFMPQGKRDINSLFSLWLVQNFGSVTGERESDLKLISDCLSHRVSCAEKYMDHAYFSAVLLIKKLLKGENFVLDSHMLDAVMAIMLHNSFYKIAYKNDIRGGKDYEPVHLYGQPLAYLLMLCDELQCWDRTPYGEVSKRQELPWDMDISVDDGSISLTYYFEEGKESDARKIASLKADINEKVVITDELADLTVAYTKKIKDKKSSYLSDGKFIDLCKIAETINISYAQDCESAGITEYMHSQFDKLTLEYKLSNVAQAKNYSRHLQKIGCFFSDRRLDYPTVSAFSQSELAYLAEEEHIRWVTEKAEMGWKYGVDYNCRKERERKRIHKDIIPYSDLTDDEKKKDAFPINNMITQLEKYGVKVYRAVPAPKASYAVAVTGHRDLNRVKGFDGEEVRGKIRAYIRQLADRYDLTVYSGCADGADLLFAEEALNCGAKLVAVLPCPWQEFIAEHGDGGVRFMRVLGRTHDVIIKVDEKQRYAGVCDYLVGCCDELLAIWDGVKLPLKDKDGGEINRGGTYDSICRAKGDGKRVTLFP